MGLGKVVYSEAVVYYSSSSSSSVVLLLVVAVLSAGCFDPSGRQVLEVPEVRYGWY
jgi:hypothetical protein